MKKTVRAPLYVRILNPITQGLLRMGLSFLPVPMTLLTVCGRRSGRLHTTPVGLFEVSGRRYLFSTFGETSWVRNIRSAGTAILTRYGIKEEVVAVELALDEAAAVLRAAFAPLLMSRLTRRMLRSQYDVRPDSSPSDFVSVARHHPVFELYGNVAPQRHAPALGVPPRAEVS